MRSDARRRGGRQGNTRSPICEKSLRSLEPRPASPHRIWNIEASSLMVLRGELSPTTANHDFNSKDVTQILRGLPCVDCAIRAPGLKTGARRAIRSRSGSATDRLPAGAPPRGVW